MGRRRRCDGGAAAHRALGCSWLQALAQMWVHQVLQLGVHWYGTCRRSMPRGHATDTGESGAARGGCSSAALLCVRRPCRLWEAAPALLAAFDAGSAVRRPERALLGAVAPSGAAAFAAGGATKLGGQGQRVGTAPK